MKRTNYWDRNKMRNANKMVPLSTLAGVYLADASAASRHEPVLSTKRDRLTGIGIKMRHANKMMLLSAPMGVYLAYAWAASKHEPDLKYQEGPTM